MLHVARGRDQSYLAAYVQIHAALVVTNGIRNVEDCAMSSRGQGTVGHGAASGQEKEYSAVDESRNNVTAWADGQVSHGAMEAVRGQLPGGGWVVGCGLKLNFGHQTWVSLAHLACRARQKRRAAARGPSVRQVRDKRASLSQAHDTTPQ